MFISTLYFKNHLLTLTGTESQRRQCKITFVFYIFVFYILHFCVLYFTFLCFIFYIFVFCILRFYVLYFTFLCFIFYIFMFYNLHKNEKVAIQKKEIQK